MARKGSRTSPRVQEPTLQVPRAGQLIPGNKHEVKQINVTNMKDPNKIKVPVYRTKIHEEQLNLFPTTRLEMIDKAVCTIKTFH